MEKPRRQADTREGGSINRPRDIIGNSLGFFGKYFDNKRRYNYAFPITSSCSQSSYLQMMNIKRFEESIAVIKTYHEMRQRADEKLARGEERF